MRPVLVVEWVMMQVMWRWPRCSRGEEEME
jgi:hypothetical protein